MRYITGLIALVAAAAVAFHRLDRPRPARVS